MKNKYLVLLISTIVSILILCGCSKNAADSPQIPYSDITFPATAQNVFDSEGSDYETYESIYEGTTYTYVKNYMDNNGTVKYMCNQNDEVMNIAWTYACDNGTDIMILYNKILSSLESENGKSTQNSDGVNNYAQVWKLDTGNIILSAVITNDSKMLQIAYLSPEVSK